MTEEKKCQGRVVGSFYMTESPNKSECAGPHPWTVCRQGDGTLEGDTVRHGLFWKDEDALLFLRAKEAVDSIGLDNVMTELDLLVK